MVGELPSGSAVSVLKMTGPATVGTLLQVAFLPRTGLNRDWVPHQQSPIWYYRAKGGLLGGLHPGSTTIIDVPPTTSFRLVGGLFQTAREVGWAEYYRQLWPAGRLLVAGNLARYSFQIGLDEIQLPDSTTPSQKLCIRVALAGCVEYAINSPFALPYTAGAAKINPDFLRSQAQRRLPPVPIPVGALKPPPGGIPRFILKGAQVGVQFSVADQTQTWLPKSFRESWPITNAFISGVLARSMVEVATVPLRNAANFRNIGFTNAETCLRVCSFPFLSAGINVIAKGLSFGMVLALNKSIDAFAGKE